MPPRLALLTALVALAATAADPARGDVPPPEVTPCINKKEGDACTAMTGAGACGQSMCQRVIPGNPPQQVTYPCLKCAPVASGGCVAAPTRPAGAGAALGLVLLLPALGAGRRRLRHLTSCVAARRPHAPRGERMVRERARVEEGRGPAACTSSPWAGG